MNNTTFKGFTIALLLILMSVVVSAAPGVPHQFYGNVLINGEPAPNNYLVEARINGAAKQTFTMDGTYGYDPIFYIEDPNNDRLGDKITFYVGSDVDGLVEAAEYTFNNGMSTELDFSVEIDVPVKRTGGGGGSSSSYVPPKVVVEDNETNTTTTGTEDVAVDTLNCTTDWICTSWGECINGQQTRTCADKNQCGTEDTIPAEKQSCELTIEEIYGDAPDAKNGFFSRLFSSLGSNKITGAVVGGGATSWIALIGLLLIIGGIFGYVRSRKNKN